MLHFVAVSKFNLLSCSTWVRFLKDGISGNDIEERKVHQLMQRWDVWKIWSIVPDSFAGGYDSYVPD
jgi:hypothetical protein